MAKASDENGSDGEGLKLREQSGLDTRNFPKKFRYKQEKFAVKNYVFL